jgi:predicted Zn-dependent protease
VLVRLGEVELMAGRQREALASARKALSLRANHAPALRMQVLLEAELGNVAAARRLVKDMQQLPGMEAFAAAVEGDLETGQQQYGVATSAYRRALSRNAALPEVPAKLHRVLRAASKQDEADAFVRDWFKDHPRDVAFMNYLGDIALSENRLADARQQYERSLALVAEQALVLNNLAWIAVQQGDAKRAEGLVAEALRMAPGEAALHDTLSGFQSLSGQHEQAQATQRRAMQLDPNPAYRVGLARRLIAAGRKDAARDELQAVQQLRDRYAGQAEVNDLLAKL